MIRAVLGGSFDPVHNGHIALAQRVLADSLADHLHVVPAARNPHKSNCKAPASHRLAMGRLAFAGLTAVTVEDLEVLRKGPSFSVDTLEVLQARHSEDQFRLVCGADNLAEFSNWKSPERLLEIAELLVFSRPGESGVSAEEAGLPASRIHSVSDFHHEVSSTEIRAMLASGKPVDNLVPSEVTAYIRAHRLYHD